MKLSLKGNNTYVIAQLGRIAETKPAQMKHCFLPKNTHQKLPTKLSALCGSLISMGETLLSDSFK